MCVELAAASAFTDWLIVQAEDVVAAERHAAYTVRVATAQPLPVVVTRHQCPHCRTTRAHRAAAAAHIARCWHNPDAHGCKTCQHFEPATDGPYPEHPGWPEECGADQGVVLEHPVIDCPFWAPHANA
ncbi:hypothetical protein [Streptomyces sp. NPDC088115]|uniref:hypothetical protein n=1 Tax=Streptomyces sp. NPDC088115 TaxID=3365824 RepID=UPI003826EF22